MSQSFTIFIFQLFPFFLFVKIVDLTNFILVDLVIFSILRIDAFSRLLSRFEDLEFEHKIYLLFSIILICAIFLLLAPLVVSPKVINFQAILISSFLAIT
jgi:hypothetical protein